MLEAADAVCEGDGSHVRLSFAVVGWNDRRSLTLRISYTAIWGPAHARQSPGGTPGTTVTLTSFGRDVADPRLGEV